MHEIPMTDVELDLILFSMIPFLGCWGEDVIFEVDKLNSFELEEQGSDIFMGMLCPLAYFL